MPTEPDCLPEVAPDVWPIGKKAACFTLFLTTLFVVLDFMDRQVLAALFPYLKAEYQLSDTQLGLLVSVVNLSIAVLVIPSGYVIDRWSRTKTMGIMTFVWSLATGACAFAGGFGQLFVARFFVGAGEAGYSPAAQSLLAASFPARLRATAMSIFMFGVRVGTPLGLVIGAVVAERWGWRHAFGVVAVPGILLSGLCLFMKDYKNVKPVCDDSNTDSNTPLKRESWGRVVWSLLTTPSLLCVFVAQAALLLYSASVMNWMPSYFNREAGMAVTSASFISAVFIACAAVATLTAGPLLDWLRSRSAVRAAYWQAGACFAAFAMIAVAFGLLTPGSFEQVALLVASTFFTSSLVPLGYTYTADLALPHQRGTAISLLVTFQNILGMAVGPLLTGFLSDHLTLGVSLIAIAGFVVLAGLLYVGVSLWYNRDISRLANVVLEF